MEEVSLMVRPEWKESIRDVYTEHLYILIADGVLEPCMVNTVIGRHLMFFEVVSTPIDIYQHHFIDNRLI